MSETPAPASSGRKVQSLTSPIIGMASAITVTTSMDATGLSSFSALALLPLLFLFWRLSHLSHTDVGFKVGHANDYGIALLFPVAVMGTIALIAWLAGGIDLTKTNWPKTAANLALMTISTFLVAIVTEEGFFRGWLWGSLEKAGMKTQRVLICSSIAFALWHISAVTLDPDFKPPTAQIPVYLCNAAVVGAVWGLLRAQSGSIIVTSLSHGLWNGLAYVLFGFGSRQGSLGIRNTALFGPENGFLGLGLNLLFACLLWRLLQKRGEFSACGLYQVRRSG